MSKREREREREKERERDREREGERGRERGQSKPFRSAVAVFIQAAFSARLFLEQ